MYLDLSRALADVRRRGGSQVALLNKIDSRIGTDKYVTLTKISDRQVQISISNPGDDTSSPSIFDIYLNETGTIRGFDTNGTGGVGTLQTPQINLTNSDGTEAIIEFSFSGITGTSASGLISPVTDLTLLYDGHQINADTTQAFLAYAKAAYTTSDTTTGKTAGSGITSDPGTTADPGGTADPGTTVDPVGTTAPVDPVPPGQSGNSNGYAFGRNK